MGIQVFRNMAFITIWEPKQTPETGENARFFGKRGGITAWPEYQTYFRIVKLTAGAGRGLNEEAPYFYLDQAKRANVRSSNPPTLVLDATLNKFWVFQMFPRIFYRTSMSSTAITLRIPPIPQSKSRSSIASGLNLTRSFPIWLSIPASIRYQDSKAEISSPRFQTQNWHIARQPHSVASGIRRRQQKQVLLLFVCTRSLLKEAIFALYMYRAGFPAAIV